MLTAAAVALALQTGTPFKLVLAWTTGGITVVDYPTEARCERARQAVDRETERRMEEAERGLPAGAVMTRWPSVTYAFCIPG